MSNDQDKFKNSKRRLKDENAVQKQLKIAKSHGGNSNYDTQPHRLVKKHAMNCGNPKCMLCGNPRKVFKEKTIQEKRFDQNVDQARDKHSNGLDNEKDIL